MGNKNKSLSSSDKSKKTNNTKTKKEKKGISEKKEVLVFIDEQQASKFVNSSKVFTVHELARQTGVKISTANEFVKKSLTEGIVERVGGFSGHYVYKPVAS
jgi:small subunit ribosomal protein S25e|tara:strand:+ start:3115 stop:3417 length:303 start_codon:yes stop_codon:yes gene_type:complete